LKKVVSHSVATAFAKRVFPVPGGPNIKTPRAGRTTNIMISLAVDVFVWVGLQN
jgi:hypothetical protein